MLKSKIHRATVMLLPTPDGPDNSALSNCELHYEGSCAIDEDLLDAANLVENEQIAIWNINNGERLATYAIRAERGSGIVSLNGSAARRAQLGDLVIIAAFAVVEESELNAGWKPYLVFVDGKNKIRSCIRSDLELF
jgi:aspartate 1-decarboxylase